MQMPRMLRPNHGFCNTTLASGTLLLLYPCTGALARASEPVAPGSPFHAAVTWRHDNVDGGLLGSPPPSAGVAFWPSQRKDAGAFHAAQKFSSGGCAALQPLTPATPRRFSPHADGSL